MHELGIATRIVDIVTKVLEDQGASTLGAVTVDLGALSGVDRSSLEFCFDALTKGTRLEGGHLNIEEVKPRAKCKACGANYEISLDDFRCKICGSSDFDIVAGTEISIRDVEVE
ncbi:MAG TPA: hydrogenase maturation nickel metallochaperone HypA [bacterium]|nr:hydrogenase maturation nickel metallochaperone HypA [bacterium]